MAKILAVDDADQNLMMIELYLKSPEFEVTTATGGREALDRTAKEQFDLILLDVVMPGMDGFEVCRRLKADPRTAYTPVIFLTARMSDESQKLQAYEIGAVDYIQKPVHKDELVARIRVMLRLEEARNRLERQNTRLGKELRSTQRELEEVREEVANLESRNGHGRPVGTLLLDDDLTIRDYDDGARAVFGDLRVGQAMADLPEGEKLYAMVTDRGVDGAALRLERHGRSIDVAVEPAELLGGNGRLLQLVDAGRTRALEERRAQRRAVLIDEAEEDERPEAYRISGLIGRSAPLEELARQVDALRQSPSTVLIHGESGTGKELVARALHFDGPDRGQPFIPIHCGAISRDLIESELFGYEKGAFTGAQQSHRGLFTVADGGTIFLDEIAETSLSLQVKLLRVLQMGEIRPVGANVPRYVDVRILAATNRNLAELVQNGMFREDLFYRLQVVTLYLPPLRERTEDIPLLIDHFLAHFNHRHGRQDRPVKGVSERAFELLCSYPWPGNVRELENVIDRAFALGVGDVVQEEDLPEWIRRGEPILAVGDRPTEDRAAPPRAVPPAEVEAPRRRRAPARREEIVAAIRAEDGDKNAAARRLGISRSTLYRRIKELDLGTEVDGGPP